MRLSAMRLSCYHANSSDEFVETLKGSSSWPLAPRRACLRHSRRLCCAALCCAALRCAALRCAALRCAVLGGHMGKRRGGGAAAGSAPGAVAADGDALLSMPVAFPGDGDGGGVGAVVAAEAPAPLPTEALQLSTPVAFPGDGSGGGGDAQAQGSVGASVVLEFPAAGNVERAPSEPADDAEATIARRIAERDEQQAAEKAAKEAKRLQKEEDKAAKAEAKAAKAEAKAAEKAAKKAEKGGSLFSKKGKGKGGTAEAATTVSAEPADTFDYEAANRRAERRAAARAAELELEEQAEVAAASSSLVRRARCFDLACNPHSATDACDVVWSSAQFNRPVVNRSSVPCPRNRLHVAAERPASFDTYEIPTRTRWKRTDLPLPLGVSGQALRAPRLARPAAHVEPPRAGGMQVGGQNFVEGRIMQPTGT
eukprot:COSAG02_NODE_12008_length_1614_cov_1.661386_2_plen_424_part_01